MTYRVHSDAMPILKIDPIPRKKTIERFVFLSGMHLDGCWVAMRQ